MLARKKDKNGMAFKCFCPLLPRSVMLGQRNDSLEGQRPRSNHGRILKRREREGAIRRHTMDRTV